MPAAYAAGTPFGYPLFSGKVTSMSGADRTISETAERLECDEPGHGRGTVVEFPTCAPKGHGHPTDREDAGRDGGRRVEEAVGNVHARHPTLLQNVRNNLERTGDPPP